MSKITQYARHLAVVAIATLLAQCAWAEKVIAINFNQGAGKATAGSDSGIPGFSLDGAAWNNLSDANGTDVSLSVKNSDGTEAEGSASITYSSSGHWNWGSASGIVKGYLDDNGAQVNIAVSNIPFAYYDLIIVSQSDQSDDGSFTCRTVNGTAYTYANETTAVGTAAWGATRGSEMAWGTNLQRINNLSGALTVNGTRNSKQRGCVAAIVIVEASAPAPIEKAMTHCYHFDSSADNAVEGGAELTAVGTAAWNTTKTALSSSGSFGSNNTTASYYIEDYQNGLAPKTGWTLSFWICPNGMNGWRDACGFSFGSVKYKFERNGSNQLQMYNNMGDANKYPSLDHPISYSDNNTSWINIVVIPAEDNESFNIYANGALVQKYTAKNGARTFGNGLPTLTRFCAGVSGIGDDRSSTALVDEAAIYNFAADATQIAWLAQNVPSEDMFKAAVDEISGSVDVADITTGIGKVTADTTLTVSAAISSSVMITGGAGTTLTIADGAGYMITEADKAALNLSAYEGRIVWDSKYVSGKACWIDYEFNGNFTNAGTDTSGMSRDTDDGQHRYGDNATDDFRPVTDGEGYDALYAGSHPYRTLTYKQNFTCAMSCTLPKVDESGLLLFGTTNNGLIGLMTGSVADNTVLLVRTTGNSKYEVMAEMSVPNPFTSTHLYVFSKEGNTIKVYLDGTLWTTYTSKTALTLGSGFQICSVHGGQGNTGINRFAPPSRDEASSNLIYKDCVIDSLRMYDYTLGANAIAALKSEFPYVSPNGSYSREVETASTWTEENAWTKAGEGTTVSAPVADSALTLTATDAESVLTVDLATTTAFESFTFNGEGKTIAVKKGEGAAAAVNAGQTVVSIPVTIEMGAMTISGGPTVLTGEGSIKFDYSALDVDSYMTDSFIQLTGMMDETEGKVTCTLPDESTYSDRTVAFGYDAASKTYRISISMNEIEIAIPSFENTTAAVTANGAAVTISEGKVTVKAGATVVVTYTGTTGYHTTGTNSETIEHVATGSAVTLTEMPVALNVYTVAVTQVANAIVSVKIGDADPVVCTTETVSVEHGKTFIATYSAAEGYMITSGGIEYRYTDVSQNFTTPYETNFVVEQIKATANGESYTTLATALAAEGVTSITLCANISEDITLTKDIEIVVPQNLAITGTISGEFTLTKSGSGTLTLNNGTSGTIINASTLKIAAGEVKLNLGNNDPKVVDPTFIIEEGASLTNYGWVYVDGTLTVENAKATSILSGSCFRPSTAGGLTKIVKKGAGTLTINAWYANNASTGSAIAFPDTCSIEVYDGQLSFVDRNGLAVNSPITLKTTDAAVYSPNAIASVTTDISGKTVKQNESNVYVVVDDKTYVAQIGETKYETLAEAVAQGGEIVLLADCSGAGIFVGEGSRTIAIDLAGFTFTCTGPAVGSTGTQSQALHLEQGNTITIKNGTITSDCDNVKMLVQNYCNLTLEGVTLDGTKLPGTGRYVLSNNCGTVAVKNSTITAKAGDIAMDSCKYRSYTIPSVEVINSTIGTVELSGGSLKITSGTIAALTVYNNDLGDGVVTKASDVELTAPTGFVWNDEGKLVVEQTGPTSWEDIKEGDDVTTIITLPDGQTETTITATELKTWADKTGANFGDTIPVNALIFNTTPAAVQAEAFVAEKAAAEVLEEVIEAEELDLAALLAKAVEAGEGGLTITSLSEKYPMATIKLVESKKISSDNGKFFQLSIELK